LGRGTRRHLILTAFFAMNDTVQIYVSLLDEAVDVWRPVLAAHIDGSVYRIVAQPYDRSIESWEFEPGDTVLCETIKLENEFVLAAVRLIPSS
jgi:hypothetical protein